MLDDNQKRIIDEMIKSSSRHDELMDSPNQNKKGIGLGCSLILLVIGISTSTLGALGATQGAWGLIMFCGVGIILSSIGLLGLISPYIVRLSKYIYKKIKYKRSTPTN